MPDIVVEHGCAKGEHALTPQVVNVIKMTQETPDVVSIRVQAKDGKAPYLGEPGQFGILGIIGSGECVFVIAAQTEEWIEFTCKRVGEVTEMLHQLSEGDEVFVRGPYGNWWPYEQCKGRDMLFIAGGIGLPPVRSFLLYCLEHREDYGHIDLVYSGSDYKDLVFKEQLFDIWPKEKDMDVHVSVYHGSEESGDLPVSYTAPFLESLDIKPDGGRVAVVCGGPSLYRTCVESLEKMGYDDGNIITTLEMRMKCGIGKCGRCNIGGRFICLDGPVFTQAEVNAMNRDA
jgi:NAD(P)H-flavin reductase